MTRVECAQCGWSNEADDRPWVLHSAKVHGWLKEGHVAVEISINKQEGTK